MNIKRTATITATLALAASGIALTTTPAAAAERTVNCKTVIVNQKGLMNGLHCSGGPAWPESSEYAPTTFNAHEAMQETSSGGNDSYPNATVKCGKASDFSQGSGDFWGGRQCRVVSYRPAA
ncbi:hypothetical protein [Streptomyces sp. ODS28]|uniref:hypothetical protein n=1 Tax=Streptomyces sp. ODS28 TaxID=3136688 RepID=UPI0031EFBF4E